MRIGIDFDNTLVCYDQLFWTLAHERGLIDDSIPHRKDAIRDDLRRRGLEPTWTAMQGEAYGPRIVDAKPFPGAIQALQEFRQRGWAVEVISHKTHVPYAGPEYDLHAAAQNWLKHQGLVNDDANTSLVDAVHLELTKQEKLNRIAHAECDWFIDDLPELLTDSAFPINVSRALFDPHRQYSCRPEFHVLHEWSQAAMLFESKERS